MTNYNRGSESHLWKGGRGLSTQGYILASSHYEHPRASKGRVLEHIIVYEQHNNCCLLRWANIHHKNHNKTDNRPENLEAMMIGEHTRMHMSTIPSDRLCDNCHSRITSGDRNGGLNWYHNRISGIGFWCSTCYQRYRRAAQM
jgi:hypothetical protein